MYWCSEISVELVILSILAVIGVVLFASGIKKGITSESGSTYYFIGGFLGIICILSLFNTKNWKEDNGEYLDLVNEREHIVCMLNDSEDVNIMIALLNEDINEFNETVLAHRKNIKKPFLRLNFNPQIAELELIDVVDYKDSKVTSGEVNEDKEETVEDNSDGKYCVHCGKEVGDEWLYCNECGESLSE